MPVTTVTIEVRADNIKNPIDMPHLAREVILEEEFLLILFKEMQNQKWMPLRKKEGKVATQIYSIERVSRKRNWVERECEVVEVEKKEISSIKRKTRTFSRTEKNKIQL